MSQICLSEILIELASCILFVRSGNPIYLLYEQGEYVVWYVHIWCVYVCSMYAVGIWVDDWEGPSEERGDIGNLKVFLKSFP